MFSGCIRSPFCQTLEDDIQSVIFDFRCKNLTRIKTKVGNIDHSESTGLRRLRRCQPCRSESCPR